MRSRVNSFSRKVAKDNPGDPLYQGLYAATTHDLRKTAQARVRETRRDSVVPRDASVVTLPVLGALESQRRRVDEAWLELDPYGSREPPTIEALCQMVAEAELKWEKGNDTSFGKFKRGCQKFLTTMDEYSFLFNAIPTEDKYIRLITGPIGSIVKISENHVKIAEHFSASLETISHAIRTVEHSATISNTSAMNDYVVLLGERVFGFLCKAMEWFHSDWKRRLMSALKKNEVNKLEGEVAAIKEVLEWIRLEAEMANQSRVLDTQIIAEDTLATVRGIQVTAEDTLQEVRRMPESLQIGLDGTMEKALDMVKAIMAAGERTRSAESQTINAKLDKMGIWLLAVLGIEAEQTLLSTGEHVDHEYAEARYRRQALRLGDNSARGRRPPPELEPSSPLAINALSDTLSPVLRREDIANLAELDAFLEYGDSHVALRLSGGSGTQGGLPQEVSARVERWFRQPESGILRIEGPVEVEHAAQLTAAAARIASLLLQAELPCVSFFGRMRYDDLSAGGERMARNEMATTALLYALIAQLIRLLPEKFARPDGGEDVLARVEKSLDALDGSVDSHDTALDMIESLLALTPSAVLFIVIDRLNVAMDDSTRETLGQLIQIFRERGDDDGVLVKVLLTTAGACTKLRKYLEKGETVKAEGLSGRSNSGMARFKFL